ncbi:MAG: DNA-processing protein DprA [Solidesulfovibrio sp.]|uniref:DNA-processing protein DprA n=2 Tax=Solidesulfovibrio sp. TaxID=2910990 RepID=UPI0031598404
MTTDAALSPPLAWTGDAAFLAELEACLRLRHAPGIGPRTWKRIFDRYDSAAAALDDARSFGPQGLCDDAAAGALARGASTPAARREMEAAAKKGLVPIPYFHPAYPARLRELPDPPAALYVVGDVGLLSGPCVALVGARQCSRYGFAQAFEIASGLAGAGITVVSGLAFGIDRQAHLGGLTGPGRSLAVCGTGLDLVYPDANLDVWRELAATGAVISEFAPGTPPQAQNFPIRNRIIAGVSLGVLVVEAAARSGSLITARLALEQGREVFALPGPVNLASFAGCHALLTQGARLVQSAGDIVAALARELAAYVDAPRPAGPVPPPRPVRRAPPEPVARGAGLAPAGAASPRPAPAGLSDLETAVLELLDDGARTHIDALGSRLGAGAGALSQALVLLEMKGLVRKLPGMYYTRDA